MKEYSIIGIDEVGRGAFAGPVVVCAAMVTGGVLKDPLGTLKDSKKLSAKQREMWYAHFMMHPKIIFAVARVYPRGIERMNISAAANLAAARAYEKVVRNILDNAKNPIAIFLDGGLYVGSKEWQMKNIPHAKTAPKADENIPAVAIASIIAKVHRDRFMRRLSKKYPKYGFDIHKGYGTAVHRAAIRKHGASDVHRLTFLKNASKV